MFFFQKIAEKFNLIITRQEINYLNWCPLEWIDDNIINFYFGLICERSKENRNLPKVFAFDTHFLQKLETDGCDGVKRWSRRTNIINFDYILIPVHKGSHWCLAVVDLNQKSIKYYDSMGAPNNHVLNQIEVFLKTKFADLDASDWHKENVANIPQQQNNSDCGIFCCMFAEFISRRREITFSQKHMIYFRKRMILEIFEGKLLTYVCISTTSF